MKTDLAGCFVICLFVGMIVVAVSFFSAWLLWLLWNWIIPAVFHGPEVTYWQAFGIMFLLSFVKGCFTVRERSK